MSREYNNMVGEMVEAYQIAHPDCVPRLPSVPVSAVQLYDSK